MSIKVTERSFYPVIINLLRESFKKHEVNVKMVEEVSIPGREFPDILVELDGYRILIQVKIDTLEKLLEDLVKSYPPARSIGADFVGILFPSTVRQIRPEEIEKIAPNLPVSRGLVLTSWHSQDIERVKLVELLESITKSYLEWKRTKIPFIDYLTIAKITRETIEELAVVLRNFMGIKQYGDIALAIVGRFDYYRAMLEDFLSEEEMRVYVADIIAYLLVLQLLFLHIISRRVYNVEIIPRIENPLSPPHDLLQQLASIETSVIIRDYYKIIGALPHILKVLSTLVEQEPRIGLILAKYIYTFYPLRPGDVRTELFGRIYQLGLPPETRKNLGAFFTRPEAAKLLAELAIEKWNDKVLDPACGSGTLLGESYQAKLRRAKDQGVDKNFEELHKLFLEEHIYGIDIMQFAKELTTINLALQNPTVRVEPKVYVGDGIEKMAHAETSSDDPPSSESIEKYIYEMRDKYSKLFLPYEGFDVVIMNPPFTRRERIPEAERERLDKLLGGIVRGKVGYWAYFFTSADNVIKINGTLAAVTPEEFFAGRSAESVRRWLLHGEVYDAKEKEHIKRIQRVYLPKYVIRSAAEIAFSEGAHYRDYLAVFKKVKTSHTDNAMIFVILKKKLSEISEREKEIAKQILDFATSEEKKLSTEYVDMRKIYGVQAFISKHIDNVKPLVGLNCIEAQELILELLEDLTQKPTLREYEKNGLIKMRVYNPGQYTTRGVEDYACRLFISRYGGRGKISSIYAGETANDLTLTIRQKSNQRSKTRVTISKQDLMPSLRTSAGVVHMDNTDEEEYAIVNIQRFPINILNLAGLINQEYLYRATNDIKQAYNDLAGNILLARRVRLTSPNVYWLTFFSERRIIGPSTMICVKTDTLGIDNSKILTLYLNSSITLLQLLGFAVETEGAWVALQGDQVWSHIHIPDIINLPDDIRKQALNVWNNVKKADTRPLYERIKQEDHVQKVIDEISLKMLGLENWMGRLNEIYNAILHEMDFMQKIIEEGEKSTQTRREINKEDKNIKKSKRQTPLDMFL
jgi:hypothetical protein